jgi:hypothetical protein
MFEKPTKYMKNFSMPKMDDVLAYSGLQRAPSTLNRTLTGIGLVGIGALLGAGLSYFLTQPRARKQVADAVSNGVEKVTSYVQNGVSNGVSNGVHKINEVR